MGDGLTFVDLAVADHIDTALGYIADYADDFPKLIEHSRRIRAIPNLAKWIETRPKTEY